MVRWPSKGLVRVYLYGSADKYASADKGKLSYEKGGAIEEKKYGSKPATCRAVVVTSVGLKSGVRGRSEWKTAGTVEHEGYEGVWGEVEVELRCLRNSVWLRVRSVTWSVRRPVSEPNARSHLTLGTNQSWRSRTI